MTNEECLLCFSLVVLHFSFPYVPHHQFSAVHISHTHSASNLHQQEEFSRPNAISQDVNALSEGMRSMSADFSLD